MLTTVSRDGAKLAIGIHLSAQDGSKHICQEADHGGCITDEGTLAKRGWIKIHHHADKIQRHSQPLQRCRSLFE